MDTNRAISVAVGVVVTVIAGFLPFVSFIAPLMGGGVAGYIQQSGIRDGARAGAFMGAVLAVLGVVIHLLGSILPAFPIAVVLGPWARGFGLGLLNNIEAILVASAVLLLLAGAIGGAIGGALAGRPEKQRSER